MCVIYFAFNFHQDYPLVLLANRDEFYDRPAAAAAYWKDHPEIFAGRDLVAGGTWLGITKNGRVAAVTNYREPGVRPGTHSRGDLVADFLKGRETAAGYMARVEQRSSYYSGFNLIVGEINDTRRELFYLSNRAAGVREITPGVYGLSNHLLDTPWPKVSKGKKQLRSALTTAFDKEVFFDLLADESLADDNYLPDTGIGFEKEKALSAIFIKTPNYGTRCSNLVTISKSFVPSLEERVFV